MKSITRPASSKQDAIGKETYFLVCHSRREIRKFSSFNAAQLALMEKQCCVMSLNGRVDNNDQDSSANQNTVRKK